MHAGNFNRKPKHRNKHETLNADAIRRSVNGPFALMPYLGKNVVVLGTAHVSADSIQDVRRFMQRHQPEVVCVELCESRFTALEDPDRWKNLDIVQVVKDRKVYLLLSSLILSAFQKKMGEGGGIRPGQEMTTAIELAEKQGSDLALVDRDIQLTLRRAWQSVSYFTKMFLFSELLSSLMVKVEVDAHEIERMKQSDVLDDIFENLPGRFRKVKEIIISERDMYLAQQIKAAAERAGRGSTVFAVVGAGHLPGIKKYFGRSIDLKPLRHVASKSPLWGVVKFLLPIAVIMTLFYIFTDTEKDLLRNIIAWVIIKASICGAAALLLLAHPLAILAAALTGPISNFNPVLKPGWVAALVEARFRRPHVVDFEKIADDTKGVMGFFKNKVTRIFAVFLLPQLASTAGTWLTLWYIANY